MTTATQTWSSERRHTFGDWGNRCLTAYGNYLWPLHIRHCAECAAVQAKWDRESEAKSRKRGNA